MAERITIVGAGPVGSLLGLMLAKRGFAVELIERRADQRVLGFSQGRSINLAVSTRGLFALHRVGLDAQVLELAIPMRGRQIHALDGAQSFQRYGKDDSEFINSMSRGGINALLMTQAEQAGARITFDARVTGYDADRHALTLIDERTGHTREHVCDVLIGTDGSASAIRHSLQAARRSSFTEELLDTGYKELHLPPDPKGLEGRFALEPHALHIWPRKSFMLIALPNPDGSFTCTLFLPFEAQGAPSFAQLTSVESVERFFHEQFPDVAELFPELAQRFLEAPLGRMVTVRTDRWSAGRTLLLGDAAHAIVPFFGQGMNAGFEDCTLLDLALEQAQGRGALDWTEVFAAFSQQRKPDADAIAELALENHIEMRDKVADPEYLLHRQIEYAMLARMPERYRTRYQLVTFSRISYRTALEAGRVQAQILREAARGKTRLEQIDLDATQRALEERFVPLIDAARSHLH